VKTSSHWSKIVPLLRRRQNQWQMCHRRSRHAAGAGAGAGAGASSFPCCRRRGHIAAALVVASAKHTLKFADDGIISVHPSSCSEYTVVAVKVERPERTHANRREAARRVVALVPRRREGRCIRWCCHGCRKEAICASGESISLRRLACLALVLPKSERGARTVAMTDRSNGFYFGGATGTGWPVRRRAARGERCQ
jgi:hypothetical protein